MLSRRCRTDSHCGDGDRLGPASGAWLPGEPLIVALDGRELRGAKHGGRVRVHLLPIVLEVSGIVLGQVSVGVKLGPRRSFPVRDRRTAVPERSTQRWLVAAMPESTYEAQVFGDRESVVASDPRIEVASEVRIERRAGQLENAGALGVKTDEIPMFAKVLNLLTDVAD